MQDMRANLLFVGFLALLTGFSNAQTVTLEGSSEVEQGNNAVYTCRQSEVVDPYRFSWTDVSVIPNVVIFSAGGPSYPVDTTKYENFDVSESGGTSTMTITSTELEDEGQYTCFEGQIQSGVIKELNVEVESTRSLSVQSTVDSNTDMYVGICEAIGGRPNETISWMLDDEPAPCEPVETYLTADAGLFSKRSNCTFQATRENYGKTLKCVITGHQLSDLNGEVTSVLNIHISPLDAGTSVTASYAMQETGIKVTCSADNEPSPVMRNYYIFSNETLIHGSMESVNEVPVSDPEVGTNYTCMAGNYLGNTSLSTAVIYDPTKTTATPTTIGFESSRATTESEQGKQCTCMSTGVSAGIAILALLLVASLIINIFQAVLLKRLNTKSVLEESKRDEKRDGRNISHEVNDNVAYEMIQSGDRAYTALKLGPKHTPIIEHEKVTFFTRLGSIGRGDFGEVWKGDFLSHQSHVDVAIRLIPDHVTKSTNILHEVKVFYQLSDQPNIVKCLGYCQEKGSILYEFITAGTLLTHLQTTGVQSQPKYNNLKPNEVRVDQDSLLNLAWQVAKGMQFLASKKIIHGALCAHNVLLSDRKQCKVSDYGLSSSLFADQGKPTRWSSPETMITYGQSTEGDIWSFGIVLWEIVTLGVRPYPNMTFGTVQTEVANGYKMPRPRHCGHEVHAVMIDCWEKEPRNRSNFDQILKSLERILEKTHSYLSLNDLDEGLYASTLDM